MMRVGSLFIALMMLCLPGHITAQETEVATMLGVGGANMLDTYLSQEKYRGVEWRLMSEVRRDRLYMDSLSMGSTGGLTYGLSHELAFAYTHNRVRNGHEYSGHYVFAYSVTRRWDMLHDALHIYVGGMAEGLLGGTYNNRNSNNNPAQGYLSAAIGAHLAARYDLTVFGKRVTVGYEARYPLVGMMFSPNYGQSYYEIFNLGNYDHNIVVTSPATFQLRQQLTADVMLKGNTSLRLGYLCDIRQATPNNLKQHHYYNAVTIGIVIRK